MFSEALPKTSVFTSEGLRRSALADALTISSVVVLDPCASSFIICIDTAPVWRMEVLRWYAKEVERQL